MMYTLMIVGGRMTDQYSIAEARRHLPTLVRAAEAGKAVELTRRGAPVALLIGRRSYERLVAGRPGFAKSFANFASDVGLDALALDPDALFRGVRPDTPGRDPVLWASVTCSTPT